MDYRDKAQLDTACGRAFRIFRNSNNHRIFCMFGQSTDHSSIYLPPCPSQRLDLLCGQSQSEERDCGPVHIKVISGFQALRQARPPVAGLEPATEGIPVDLRADSPATVTHGPENC
ncbi:hypothetical protein PoB_005014000 [Plakobranchus ocellatus]|uniref:Uncharacterized protein n=1 Tax=Plakobranchus ocellatus TaxID=259542 RepID=A0AAV4BT61_9GAST|nr:hypothetical protein PoB_005014000 [Plakobranchus ocellatus]